MGHAGGDGFQQVWPVAFDGHEVVRAAHPGQVVGGRVLGVSRVRGDGLRGQVDRVEQSGHTGDLGGVGRHGDLGDDDLLMV